ncbi:MAG: COX15/CtaA family protein, partial [Solirubrobacterales bacterium]
MNRFRRLADLTVLATFALIVLGGIVRVSESGLGCGPGGSGTEGWPLCNGEAVPFFGDTSVIIEFSHRLLAAVVTALIVLLAWTAYKRLEDGPGDRPKPTWPLRASIAAGVLVLVQAALGGLTVERSLDEELVAAHLGLAMLLLGLLLWISV